MSSFKERNIKFILDEWAVDTRHHYRRRLSAIQIARAPQRLRDIFHAPHAHGKRPKLPPGADSGRVRNFGGSNEVSTCFQVDTSSAGA